MLAPSGASLFVGLNDYDKGSLLASSTIAVAASLAWQQISFTLTPSASTPCVGITPGSNPNIDCGAWMGARDILRGGALADIAAVRAQVNWAPTRGTSAFSAAASCRCAFLR